LNHLPFLILQGDEVALSKERSRKEKSLVVAKLTKTFKSATAVKEISMAFEPGRINVLLGVNGAGKSTLFNMLTGGVEPTNGNAFLNGHDIRTEMSVIQNRIGLCPQDDLLWESLTAEDHVFLFASMRGWWFNKRNPFKTFAKRVLQPVNLDTESSGKSVSAFSGGMKRRLMLVLATIARQENPLEVLFLDEPTTGMDPVNKRMSWRVIEQQKKDKIVVLTTHSMEEADALGDHICIMHSGRLKASGTSLFLKNHYGNGYRLKIIVHDEGFSGDAESLSSAVKALVQETFPRVDSINIAGGVLTIQLDKRSVKDLPEFIQKLENLCPTESNEQRAEWGLSSTTLDEVFLKLCASNTGIVSEDATNQSNDGRYVAKSQRCLLCGQRESCEVTLFTKQGTPVTVDGVVCMQCADSESIQADNNDEDDLFGNPGVSVTEPSTIQSPLISNRDDAGTFFFQNVSAGEEIVETNEMETMQTLHHDAKKVSSTSLWCRQAFAVVKKNASIQRKQKKTNICLILITLGYFATAIVVLMLIPSGTRSTTQCAQGTFFL
jgi:ABC-type multidrug transport system ATPase subunit